MKTIAALSIQLIAVWAVLSGPYSAKPLILALAVVSLIATIAITRRVDRVVGSTVPLVLMFGWTLRVPRYAFFMVRKILSANVRVTRLLLDPRVTIRPRVLRVRMSPTTELGQVVLANSITLTPGTVTLDVDGDELLVHALGPVSASSVLNGEMDRAAAWLEGSAPWKGPASRRPAPESRSPSPDGRS
jgi:multicomponent Na+:H+ antiporter subunit E